MFFMDPNNYPMILNDDKDDIIYLIEMRRYSSTKSECNNIRYLSSAEFFINLPDMKVYKI